MIHLCTKQQQVRKSGDSKRSAVPRKGASLGGVAVQGRTARHGGGLEGANRT